MSNPKANRATSTPICSGLEAALSVVTIGLAACSAPDDAASEEGGTGGRPGSPSVTGGVAGAAVSGTELYVAPTTSPNIVWPPEGIEGCWAFEHRRWNYPDDYGVEPIRYTYDSTTRILTRAYVDDLTETAFASDSLFYRVNEAGWTITYAGEGFRHDHHRDGHQNVIRFEFVYGPWTDLTQPAYGSLHMAYDASHTYNTDGKLVATTLTEDGNVTTFEYAHDPEGHCERIVTEGDLPSTETRSYADGRLQQAVVNYPEGSAGEALRVVTDYSYDAAGRTIAVEQDGGGHWFVDADGMPDMVQYWTYEADGSYSLDWRDYTSDIANDSADGRGCRRTVTTFSAGCNELLAQIPIPDSLECHYNTARTVPLRP